MDMSQLYDIACRTVRPTRLRQDGYAGGVACALQTQDDAVFTGICIDMPCALGFCAEAAAIAEMLKSGRTIIKRIITVREDGAVLSACGRCRELIRQLHDDNIHTLIAVSRTEEISLEQLLPNPWN